MAAENSELIVLCLLVPYGIDENVAALVDRATEDVEPDYRMLIQPETYLFFFRNTAEGKRRVAELDCALDGLRKESPRLAQLKLGRASGPFIFEVDSSGTIATWPIGAASTDAQRQARTS